MPAQAEASYEAFAKATGADVALSNQTIPAVDVVTGGGPEANVRQTSFGVGDANAQLPYAGDDVPGLIGIVSAATGVPLFPYPFIASSTRGTEPSTVTYPGVALRAESQDFSTLATSAAAGTGASAGARIDENRDGDVTAQALAENAGIRLGPLAGLSGVSTSTRVVANALNGKLVRKTSTSIGRINVPGLVLTIPASTPGSTPGVPPPIPGAPGVPSVDLPVLPVPVGGQTVRDPDLGVQDGHFTITVPTDGKPTRFLIPAEPVLKALAAVGISMTFQSPEELPTGVISGTYRFAFKIPAPPDNPLISGPTTVMQTTGFAVSLVNLSPAPSESPPGAPPVVAADGGTTVANNGPGDLAGSPAGQEGGGPSAEVTDGAHLPQAGPPVAAPAPEGPAPELSLAAAPAIGVSIGNIYLALVAVAVIGLVAAGALQLLGVRSLWI